MAKVNSKNNSATVAEVATVAETVAQVKPVVSARLGTKYNGFADKVNPLADLAAMVNVARAGKVAWPMPTHGTAASGVAGTACKLWLAAYTENGNTAPTLAQLASAVNALVAQHPQVKAGRGVTYTGATGGALVGWALGYLCYTGKKCKGKPNLLQA